MIQQFQPKYDPSLNMEPEPIKPIDNTDQLPAALNTVVQTPYTIVTKTTPITNDNNKI